MFPMVIVFLVVSVFWHSHANNSFKTEAIDIDTEEDLILAGAIEMSTSSSISSHEM